MSYLVGDVTADVAGAGAEEKRQNNRRNRDISLCGGMKIKNRF